MAERPKSPRIIPNFALTEPWSAPMTAEQQEGLAMTGLLSGAAPNDRSITTLLRQFAGDYVVNLGKATG